MIDFVVRYVKDHGYLPIVADVSSHREYYRGEYQESAGEALYKTMVWYEGNFAKYIQPMQG